MINPIPCQGGNLSVHYVKLFAPACCLDRRLQPLPGAEQDPVEVSAVNAQQIADIFFILFANVKTVQDFAIPLLFQAIDQFVYVIADLGT